MDALIVLDPWDIYQLKKASGCGLEKLLNVTVRLEVIDGLIQPVLAMAGGVCPYLGADGRCEIHTYRPGICRLYPLGRCWEDGDFSYILQTGECTHCTGSKVKVKKWLGIPDLSRYEAYCRTWHAFLKAAQACCGAAEESTGTEQMQEKAAGSAGTAARRTGAAQDHLRKIVCMQILEKCYLAGFDTEKDFYPQFEEQLQAACRSLGIGSVQGL
jgi:Fe-S-cluster containining protein